MEKNYIHSDLTKKIIKAFYNVYNKNDSIAIYNGKLIELYKTVNQEFTITPKFTITETMLEKIVNLPIDNLTALQQKIENAIKDKERIIATKKKMTRKSA